MDETEAAAGIEAINAAIAGASVPKIAANGFRNLLGGGGDLISVATLNGHPQCVLVMSFTTAKTYAQKILELIQRYETNTGSTVPTVDELIKMLLVPDKPTN